MILSGQIASDELHVSAATLAHEIDLAWRYGKSSLSTLYDKARRWNAGETVEFGGKKYPPLYTPRNGTLIDWFEITDVEQRTLRTVISRDMARERRRER